MTRKLLFALGIIAVLVIGARPALAHHGGAAFDQTKQQTLQGTVTMLDFVNPHVVVWFDVANPDGTTTEVVGMAHRTEQAAARRVDQAHAEPRRQSHDHRQPAEERQPGPADPHRRRTRRQEPADLRAVEGDVDAHARNRSHARGGVRARRVGDALLTGRARRAKAAEAAAVRAAAPRQRRLRQRQRRPKISPASG